MLVLFALMLTALVGLMGLVLDLGYAYVQRRTAQNAADAAVTIALADIEAGTNSVNGDVSTVLGTNRFPTGAAVSSSWTCTFIDNSDAPTGSGGGACASNSTIPSQASGVTISVTEAFPTFVLKALQLNSITVSATSAGHVETANTFDASQAPFIVCGDNTWLQNGGSMWILNNTGSPPQEVKPPSINPAAVGQTFNIHDSHVDDCGMGSSFKGNASTSNGVTTLPGWLAWQHGDRAGPTRARVRNGCTGGNLDNCVLILPIAENSGSPPPGGLSCTGSDSSDLCAVLWAPFLVHQTHANAHSGTLLSSATVQSVGSLNWTPGTKGVVSVRMTK